MLDERAWLAALAILGGCGGEPDGRGYSQVDPVAGAVGGASSTVASATSTGSDPTTTTTGTNSGVVPSTTASTSSAGVGGSTGTTNSGTTTTSDMAAASTTGAGGASTTTEASTTSSGSTTGGASPSSGCGLPAETGTFQGTVEAFGLERSYHMSVPESYDSSVPQRLVFGYHGSNYTGQMMRQYLDLEKEPLLEGTLFVYPDGIGLDDQPDHIAWELGAEDRDIAFFDALLDKLKAEYCIDESRIFVNGQSFGGLMTNAVGCIRGDVVRAVAVVAGSGPRGAECSGQVAAWLTHGVDDTSVSFSSGEASRDHYVELNGCSETTMATVPEQCVEYQGCDDGFPVIWCPHENDGGHQHPSFGREAVRNFLASF